MTIHAKGVIHLNEAGREAQRAKINNLIQTLFWIVTRSDDNKLSMTVACQEDVRTKPNFFRVVTGYNYNGTVYLSNNFGYKLEYSIDMESDFERIAVDLVELSYDKNTGYRWVDVFVPHHDKAIADWIIENSETSKLTLSRPVVFKTSSDGQLGFTEEGGLQYIRLNLDYQRFTEMVLHRYSKLKREQIDLIGIVTLAHSEFVKTNAHKALREALDKFFSYRPKEFSNQLFLHDKQIDLITSGEWSGELMGEHDLPSELKSIHYKCEYTSGGQNWDMQAGLRVNVQLIFSDHPSEEFVLFVDEKSATVYREGFRSPCKLTAPFELRQIVFGRTIAKLRGSKVAQ